MSETQLFLNGNNKLVDVIKRTNNPIETFTKLDKILKNNFFTKSFEYPEHLPNRYTLSELPIDEMVSIKNPENWKYELMLRYNVDKPWLRYLSNASFKELSDTFKSEIMIYEIKISGYKYTDTIETNTDIVEMKKDILEIKEILNKLVYLTELNV
jgi:hypothetical protein